MAKKPKKKAVKSWLVQHLRRISRQWPPKNWAKANARIERGKYLCAHCEGIFGPNDISLDHIEPVVDPETGFIDWNTYIERLFVQSEGYQVLCNGCHDIKTELENELGERNNFQKKS